MSNTKKLIVVKTNYSVYNIFRWTSKPPELHTIMKKCNGTGLVLKICETKNNVWKRYKLSIQNSIDNHIEIT